MNKETTQEVTVLTQDFFQTETYHSESKNEDVLIRHMPVPHALRALAKIEKDYGMDHLSTPLCRALAERVTQAGDVTEVPCGNSTGVFMMVDPVTKRFTGVYRKYERKT